MQIGIIGNGKMGTDIFNHFFEYEHKLVWICKFVEEIQKLTAAVEKQLKKMLKRGLITEDIFEKKMQSFTVSTDFTALKNCDLVIEAVFEDLALKQEIFENLETIVSEECILASNTSSIPLNTIFKRCTKKERCLGIHFFFPVKVTKTVEINKTRFTEQKHADTVKELLIGVNKSPLELKEEANMILSKMLLNMISLAYIIYEEKYLSIEEIDKVLKEHLVTFGLFEIIDSTGINIILQCRENFISDRCNNLYAPFFAKGKYLVQNGYPGGPGNKGITAYEQEHGATFKETQEDELNEYKQNIVLRMQSLLINEVVFAINNQSVEKDQINEAVKEVLGLSEDPSSMLKRVGQQKIIDSLLDSCQKSQDNVYQPLDLSVFSN